jgi:hypothetical protein
MTINTAKAVRIEIEYADGSIRRLTDPAECLKWEEMVNSQATMAFVHGVSYAPLKWEMVPSKEKKP